MENADKIEARVGAAQFYAYDYPSKALLVSLLNFIYQADWLLSVYGFSPPVLELALGKGRNLASKKEPKLAISQNQPWLFPVDMNKVNYNELSCVPGIGPSSARRIIEACKDYSISSLEQLKNMWVAIKRATPFIWFQGMLAVEKQTPFFSNR